ncbi:MAG: PAS domain-containing sensor histidine kinase [Gemmatimonadetes bacterium]|jgi:two-component system sensor histidine kinase NreB|nr:PAS domain-containing sensor histidine kinase [Gemmatimonadota bacterium]MBT4610475.1 PAS domain-containing sensor histidine kinase [Gemmatimonadota bacterium]MBT5057934.1 PAS domain-containing sensor histidine kinase [Gemmatimonadota bacterium]MBT5587973.1 PAS domain-containing sensor histidine kinase [Gemmatimonadota bacterium]MBT7456506.1 PAS domain-containing sensor histidine kinase [Gemmatimonadota bacterium]
MAGRVVYSGDDRQALILQRDRTHQVTAQIHQEALSELRGAVWDMASPDDIDGIIRAMRDTLRKCGVDFFGCGVNLIDMGQTPSVRVYVMQTGDADTWKEEEPGVVSLIQRFVCDGKTVYRRDLLEADSFSEKPRLHRQQQVRSVLDVPFSHGTLAINSVEADAFSPVDIGLVEEMAQILAETLTRADDLARSKAAAGSLLATESRYRALFHGASDAVITFARTSGIVEANEAAAQLIGSDVSDLIGRRAVDIIHPDHWRRAIVTWQHQIRAGRPVYLETVMVDRDGRQVPVAIDGSRVDLGDETQLYVIIARDISERQRLERLSRTFARQSERLQEDQRRQIARALHDGVNQVLSATATRLHLAAADGPVSEDLETARKLLDQTILEIRRISRDLRPTVLDDLGLLPALRSLGKRFEDEEGVGYILRSSEGLVVPPEIASVAYRIVQESLTNVARHAQAHQVQVECYVEGKILLLRISDDGIGFDPTTVQDDSQRIGLRHLQERAQMLLGKVTIQSSGGTGTTIVVRLPLSDGGEDNDG